MPVPDVDSIDAFRAAIHTVQIFLADKGRGQDAEWPTDELALAFRVTPLQRSLIERYAKKPDGWLNELRKMLRRAERIPVAECFGLGKEFRDYQETLLDVRNDAPFDLQASDAIQGAASKPNGVFTIEASGATARYCDHVLLERNGYLAAFERDAKHGRKFTGSRPNKDGANDGYTTGATTDEIAKFRPNGSDPLALTLLRAAQVELATLGLHASIGNSLNALSQAHEKFTAAVVSADLDEADFDSSNPTVVELNAAAGELINQLPAITAARDMPKAREGQVAIQHQVTELDEVESPAADTDPTNRWTDGVHEPIGNYLPEIAFRDLACLMFPTIGANSASNSLSIRLSNWKSDPATRKNFIRETPRRVRILPDAVDGRIQAAIKANHAAKNGR